MGGHSAEAGQSPELGRSSLSPEDQEISRAIAEGNRRGALSLCVRHYAAPIGRLCMALLGSASEADDLTQETLLDAHAGFDGFRGEGSMRAWLLSIARRKCARYLERNARQRSRLRLVHDSARGETSEDLLARRQRAEKARAALAHIRPSEREALVLRYASELSFKEVGVACGIEEATARKRVSRALSKLRDAVGNEE